MRARLGFLVGAVVIAVAAWNARAQDLAPPLVPQPEQPQPKAAPKLTKPPQLKKTVEQNYPPEALAARLSADVTMMVDIDAAGNVSKVEVTKAAGQGFDEAAREAVLQYQFLPAEIDGKPAAIRIEYTLHFMPKVVEQPDAGTPDAEPPPPPPPPPPPDIVVAKGRMRESGTRDPIAGAEVVIITRTPEGLDKPAVVVGGTDEEGRFEVKSLPGNGMRVIVTEPRHEPCIRDVIATDARADKPFEIDCLVRKSGAPPYETTVRTSKPSAAVTR